MMTKDAATNPSPAEADITYVEYELSFSATTYLQTDIKNTKIERA